MGLHRLAGQWFNLGILTLYTPLPSDLTTQIQSYEASMCGTWSTATQYDYTASSIGISIVTVQQSLYSTLYVYTYPLFSTTTLSTTTAVPTLVPAGWQLGDWFSLALNKYVPKPTSGTSVQWGVTVFDEQYIQPEPTELPDGQKMLGSPPGLVPWLAQQSSIKSAYPYIENCWTIGGVGQPTVNVAVLQLTASSTNFVEMDGAAMTPVSTATPQPAAVTAIPAMTNSAVASLVTQARSTESAATQAALEPGGTMPKQDTPITGADADNLPGAIGSVAQQACQTSTADAQSDASPIVSSGSPTAQAPPQLVSSTDSPSMSPNAYAVGAQTTSAGGVQATVSGAVYTALPSGSGVQIVSSAATTIVVPSASNVKSIPVQDMTASPVPAYAIGSQTITAGGNAVTVSGTAYSALPSGSGIQAIASGSTTTVGLQTSGSAYATTLPGGQVISSIGSATQVVTIGGSALTAYAAASSALIIGSVTVRPSAATVVNSATVSFNGTNLIVAASTGTSTEGLGEAIISGLNGLSQGSTTGSTPAAYTGSGSGLGLPGGLVYMGMCVVMMAVLQ